MTGIDASSQFADVLDNSPNYVKGREVWLGQGVDKFPDEYKGQFEIVTASGVFLKSHMPARAMEDCHAALKTYGFFVTAMRSIYWEFGNEEGYREQLEKLVAENKLKLVATHTFMRGVEGETGLFLPQESRMMCYQRID